MIFESVINISEGRDTTLVGAIAGERDCVRNIHTDSDHNRSVLTLASRDLEEVFASAQNVVGRALETLSLDKHEGVHPRLGVVDVVPFVSYSETNTSPTTETIEAAHRFGAWLDELGTPVFFYDMASPEQTSLPTIRKNAFVEIMPSLTTQLPNIKTGSTCVGAREPLIAINVNLDSRDVNVARSIARDIRESSGGIPGVRAIGLYLAGQEVVQVSMNIVDALNVDAESVCQQIRERAEKEDCTSEVELVGLVPHFQFEKWTQDFLIWSGLTETCTVENYL